jgi:type IV secretory pathway TrbF-like protein
MKRLILLLVMTLLTIPAVADASDLGIADCEVFANFAGHVRAMAASGNNYEAVQAWVEFSIAAALKSVRKQDMAVQDEADAMLVRSLADKAYHSNDDPATVAEKVYESCRKALSTSEHSDKKVGV